MADEIYINEIRQIRKENGITQDTTTLLSTRLNTVQPKTLVQGETAQASSGEPIEGTLNPVSKDDAYMKTDSLSVDMADDDYLPFYDTSEKKKHNIPINKLLEKLKEIFVPVSAKFSTLIHSARTLDIKSTDIYATFNDNNVSETVYPSANNILDARGNIITRFESVVNPDGKIGVKIYVRNYYEDGTMCGQKGLQWHMDKVGNITYKIDDYDGFRQAIHTVDQQGEKIPDNTDIDTYKTAGTYKVDSDASAQTMTNLPTNVCGKLVVFDNGNGGYEQFYFSNHTPRIYIRTWWSNAWTDWIDLSQGGGSPNDFYSIKSGNYTASIQNDDDLNDYTSSGTYDCFTSATAQTLLNCPVDQAFKLMVDTENNPNLVSQTITIINKTNAMPWYRSKTTEGSWSAWKQFSAGLHTYDIGINIPANSDLNDYKTEGVYKIAPNATMETISHRPCDRAGKLVVYNGLSSGNNYYKQIFYDVENKEFSRICNNNNVWGEWQQAGNELLNIRYATSIPANSDLNTYRTLGTYFWTQGNSSNISNTPYNNDAGILYVIRAWENDNYYHQIVIARNANDIYERRYDVNANPQWSDWKRLSFVYEELATAGTEIPDNSDLNTYITYGKYYAQDKTHANTMSNTPTITGGFTLYVMRRTNLTQITQFMLMNNYGSCDTYIRSYDTGTTTWSTWLRIATMDDVTSSQLTDGYAVATISGSTITATIDGFQLKAGAIVTIRIPSNLTSACTLNISNTGAKSIKLQIGIDPTSGYPLSYGVNTFIYDGTYYRLVAFNFTPFIGVQNYTANTSGSVLIDWGYGVNRAQIKYGIGDNKLAWNYFKNSAWRGDVKIADYDDLITQKGTLIPENSDLNDYTTAGVYYIPTNAYAETMSNIPVKGSGKLIVCKTDTDLRVIQLYITNGQNLQNSNYETIFYTRAIDNDGTARPWHRVTQNVNGLINLYGETTTSEDKYVGINAQIKDTTTNKAYTLGILKAYQDHQATPYGFNLVMNGGGATIVASGEAGNNFYNVMTANQKISEHLFLMADAYLYLEANANASANRQGFMLHTNGSLLPVKAEVATDNFGDIGESSHKLANIWVYKINGSTPVTSDNVIVSNTVLGSITSLDDIPLNTAGWVTLDASISPLGGQLGFQYLCYGYSGRKTIDLTRVYHGSKNTEERWYNSYDSTNSSWTGWIPLSRTGTYVGTCTTASDQQAKEATVDDDFSLKKGVRIAIKFSNTNTYSSTTANPVTLNVNNTSAKNIWFNTTHSGAGNTGTATICYGTANRYIYYVYDGTYWVWDGYGVDNNNTNFLRNDASSTLTASGSAFLNVKSSTIDMTQADNAVTTTQYPAYITQDKNGKDMSRLETVVEPNGQIRTYIQVCNYNTTTNAHFRAGISMLTNKSQDMWYSLSNPHYFHRELGFGYGTCSTAGSERVKVVTMARFRLVVGGIIGVKFSNTNTYSATADNKVCLNVNGTGEKPIYYNTGYPTGTMTGIFGYANRVVYYMYDGTNWCWLSFGYDNDSTYSPQSLGFGYGTCATAEATTAKVVTLSGYELKTNGYVSVKFTNAVPASATMNINSKGAKAIYYRGSAITAGVIKAGDLATFIYNGSQYHLVAIDGVSVNALIGNQDITTAVTSLDNIPVNTAGKIKLSASIAPLSTVAEYVYMCYGGNNFKTIQLTRANHSNYNTEELWINSNNGSGWTGWLPISRLGTYMGGCRSAGDEQVKSAVVDLDFSLKVGVRVGIKFNNTNTFSATADAPCKLNVNSTGEYAIYYNAGLPTGTATQVFGYANRYTYYIFDGSYWVWDGCGVDSNTTYSNMSLSEFKTGTATSQRTLQATVLNQAVNTYATAYGTCTTGAGEKAKVATVTDSNWKLRVGAIVGIKFTNTNTYSNATADPITLNVNNTGAKNIWYANTHSGAGNTGTSTTAYGRANYINYYMYDGTYWVWQSSSVDNNSTYSPQSLGIGYGTCTTAEATTAKVATLSGYSLVTNGIVAIKFTYAVPASSTLNINSKGAKSIYHRGSAITGEIIKAGDIATFIYNGQYHLLGVDRTAGYKDTISAGRCITSGSVPQKFVNFTDYVLVSKSQLYVLMTTSNTAKQALTLEVNNTGAKPIYINGSVSSSSNYTLPAGTYLVYYNGTNFYFRTDGKITCAGTVTV